MCRECDTLRRHIAAARACSTELTDPVSISLNKADLRWFESRLIRLVAEHRPAEK